MAGRKNYTVKDETAAEGTVGPAAEAGAACTAADAGGRDARKVADEGAAAPMAEGKGGAGGAIAAVGSRGLAAAGGSGAGAGNGTGAAGPTGGDVPPVLELRNAFFSYGDRAKGTKRAILRGAEARFELGRMYAILGPSGCGKSTLLGLLGGLDVLDSGSMLYKGARLEAGQLAAHRRDHVSFVFQGYNLIDYLTAAENVSLTTRLPPLPLLERLGLGEQEARRSVLRLSGGQQQRVAIARALARPADVLLADEPTGNLDEETADGIVDILLQTAHDLGRCVICVTHSNSLARRADAVLRLDKGKLVAGDARGRRRR